MMAYLYSAEKMLNSEALFARTYNTSGVDTDTHALPIGQVDAESISKRHEQIKSGPGVRVEDGKDTITYSFIRALGDARDNAHHVFTKEGNLAHPAVMFLRSQWTTGSNQLTNTSAGSYAGSKEKFEGLYMALQLMNQGR